MIITLAGNRHEYQTKEELAKIIAKYPNINFKGSYKIGDHFTAGDSITPVNHVIIPNGYRYTARCYKSGETWYIKLGCHLRTVQDWEDDFWNNDNEFPNDGSDKSNNRFKTYNALKSIIEFYER